MEDINNLLLEFFNRDARYHTKEEIQKKLKLKGESKLEILNLSLNKLEETGKIFFDKKFGYRIFPSKSGFAYGKLEINKSGTGFVHTNNNYIILIENNDLNGALDGDNVIVYNIFSKRKDYYSGEVYKITKRKTGQIIYEVVGTGKYATIIPYNGFEYVNISINPNELKDLIDGDYILVDIGCESNNGVFKGTINRVLGNKNDLDIDIKLIFEKNNIPVDFSEDLIKEVKSLPQEVKKEDLIDRIDLRDENVFTIDCDDTKDRDDAVSIKKLTNGNYLLKVSIAHVSYYIKENSLSFEEAIKRTTSHYLANTCNPMFHPIISNGICSLNPNEDRLTRTVEMEIDNEGNIVNYKIYKSVINSKMAMSYSNVNKVLKGELIPEYEKYRKDLELLNELNTILEEARRKRNYLNFNTHEVKYDEKSTNNMFYPNELGLAGEIIENCMLVANTTVYRHFAWFILAYRVHEAPNQERVKEVIKYLKTSGIKIKKFKNIDSASLKNIIDSLEDNEVSEIIREFLLRSMKKARYDIVNIGHFALQYLVYGHFTSPIRRIIDFITHMTIDNIETFEYTEESIKKFEEFLRDVCEKANKIERLSKTMEDEAMDMRMAEYMENHIGEEYEVYITGINKYSMLVRTKNLIRGKIKLDNMYDDTYYYDYDKKAIIGRNTKKRYYIGNKIVVLVKDASKNTRTINFEIPKQKVKRIS